MVAFDNDAVADEFVEAVSRPGGFFFLNKEGHFQTVNNDEHTPARAFVRGMWQKPTQFCECSLAGKKDKSFTRGKKYGWWVHRDCGKPTAAWSQGEHFYYSHGTNLLPVSVEAPEWRGNGVHGHNWDEETKQWVHYETGVPWDPQRELQRIRQELGL